MLGRFLALAALLLLLAAIQVNPPGWASLAGSQPDLLLLLVVLVGFLRGLRAGMIVGFAAGLVQGALLGAWIGPWAVAKTVAGWAGALAGARMFRDHWAVPVACVVFATCLHNGIFWLLAHPVPLAQALRLTALTALYNALVTPFLLAFLTSTKRWILPTRT